MPTFLFSLLKHVSWGLMQVGLTGVSEPMSLRTSDHDFAKSELNDTRTYYWLQISLSVTQPTVSAHRAQKCFSALLRARTRKYAKVFSELVSSLVSGVRRRTERYRSVTRVPACHVVSLTFLVTTSSMTSVGRIGLGIHSCFLLLWCWVHAD
jgi:hypothetical protein